MRRFRWIVSRAKIYKFLIKSILQDEFIYYDISHKNQGESTQSLSKNIQFSSRNQIKDEKREREKKEERGRLGGAKSVTRR